MKQIIKLGYAELPQYPDCDHALIDTDHQWQKTTDGEVTLIPMVKCKLKSHKNKKPRLCISVNELNDCPGTISRDGVE